MMSAAADSLRAFHRAFDVPAPSVTGDRPGVRELAKRRVTLHDEEHAELHDALRDLMAAPGKRVRIEAVARELADVLVISYGTAELLGIDLDRAFAEVMRANMAKLPPCPECSGTGDLERGGALEGSCWSCKGTGKGKPIKRFDGKVLKPDGWTPPRMSEAVGEPS